MSKRYFSIIMLLIVSASCWSQQQNIYIKAGKLYDSEDNKLLKNKLIQIQGRKIVSIGEFKSLPENSQIIDLTECTVLPGLIDAHTHVLFSQEAHEDFTECSIHTLIMEDDATRALRGSARARSYLMAGITSIKDLGNSGLFLDVALRNAIDEGILVGPRIFASGQILAAAGGQMYDVPAANQSIIDGEYRIVKNAEDAQNAVREHVNQKVDLIKICADNIPNNTRLTVEEIKSIVDMAHSYNLTVTAHCITNKSAYNAIMGGVDGIEHGFNISDTTLALMAKKNIYLVPTENSKTYMLKYAELAGHGPADIEWIDRYIGNMAERLKKAIQLGVPIVAGSDNYTKISGLTRGESSSDMFRMYYESGMKPLDIIQSSTYLSAYHFGKEDEIGQIAPNSFADIIAVKGDIEADFLNTISNIEFVMKDGAIYVDETSVAAQKD